jgi:hypothetical protein
MDLKNKVPNFEDLRMFNPLQKSSIDNVGDVIKYSDFYLPVYPQYIWDEVVERLNNGNGRPPKCIFLPEKVLMK